MQTFSKTAIMAAAFRARATAREFPICDDPWAQALAGEEGRALVVPIDARLPQTELGVALRTAYFDRQVVRWTHLTSGFRQVVVLGAGLDTRAARLAREGLRFFEVDHPATLLEKRQRLLALPGYPIHAATHVSCNFEKQDFVVQLGRAGFDLGRPAVLLWEGVTAYLREAAVRNTLEKTARQLNAFSVIVFDYLAPEPPHFGAKGAFDRAVANVGEPFLFRTADIAPLLREAGFSHVQALSLQETSSRAMHSAPQFLSLWRLAVASCGSPLTN